jgi:hypothetical protein
MPPVDVCAKFLGAIWGFTRPFERISRFWRIAFIPKPPRSAYFENCVKSDSRRLHQLFSMNMGLRAFCSRRLHYFSTAMRPISVPVSNNRIAASSAAGLRCM